MEQYLNSTVSIRNSNRITVKIGLNHLPIFAEYLNLKIMIYVSCYFLNIGCYIKYLIMNLYLIIYKKTIINKTYLHISYPFAKYWTHFFLPVKNNNFV